MEVIKRDSLPHPLLNQASLAFTGEDQSHRLKLSLYIPAHRSDPARRWRTARLLLKQSQFALGRAAGNASLKKGTARLYQLLGDENLLRQYPGAQGYALFLDGEHVEIQALLTPCTPTVVAGPIFHVLPLLRSLASEPHYRIIALERNKGTVLRRDHDGFKTELKIAFPGHSCGPAETLHPRATARDLERIWHNVATFSQALLHVQTLDPRPLGIIGEERLRRLFIDDMRPSLTRPIFFQEPPSPNQDPLDTAAVMVRADQAFAIRVAKHSPCDIAQLLGSAAQEGRALSGWATVSDAADKGLIECLLMGHHGACTGRATRDKAGAMEGLGRDQNPENPSVDELVKKVLRSDGAVLFAESNRENRLLPNGIAAITRATGKTHLTH